MALEDVHEVSYHICGADQITENFQGRDVLLRSLSQLFDRVMVKAVEAKRASRDCILRWVAQTKAEIDSAERHKYLLTEVLKDNQGNLAITESQLALLMHIVDECRLEDVKDDVSYYHAVYADELVVLTIADVQVGQMEQVSEGDTSLSSSDDGLADEELFTGLLSSDDTVLE
jgi:hypothetical protein